MRRLLPATIAVTTALVLASPALADNRVPAGVKRISVALTIPPQIKSSQKSVHRTFTGTSAVTQAVHGADLLKAAKLGGVCPMFVKLSPSLTVVFRGAKPNSVLAEVQVAVELGSRSSSGSSPCWPIHFSSRGHEQALVGNSFVRLIGRLLATPIS